MTLAINMLNIIFLLHINYIQMTLGITMINNILLLHTKNVKTIISSTPMCYKMSCCKKIIHFNKLFALIDSVMLISYGHGISIQLV